MAGLPVTIPPPTIPPLPPVIDAGGLRLRGLRPGDAAALLAYLSDPAVTEHTSIPEQSLESVRDRIERRRRGYIERTSCVWALARVPDDGLIGICGFNSWSVDHGWCELAYELARAEWGKGVMSRAVTEALRWGFEVAGFHRVQALVMTSNAPSVRLLERAGFIREGTLRGYRPARGVHRDFWMYGMLRPEWAAAGRT